MDEVQKPSNSDIPYRTTNISKIQVMLALLDKGPECGVSPPSQT
jgi:hypothetical protein